jgi:hypothetical protein
VVKQNRSQIQRGDIPSASYECRFRYNSTWDSWVMENPGLSVLPTGFRNGCIPSYVAAKQVSVSAGAYRDSTDAFDIRLPVALTGTIQSTGSWAAGTNQPKLDTGALAAAARYHLFLIRKDSDGSADFLFSLSSTAPTMPSGYTAKRRILCGYVYTNDNGDIRPFHVCDDEYSFDTPINDVNGVAGSQAVTLSVSVATGVIVFWRGAILFSAGSGPAFIYASALDSADVIPNLSAATDFYNRALNGSGSWTRDVKTNVSGQFRVRWDSAPSQYWVNTYGYRDPGLD